MHDQVHRTTAVNTSCHEVRCGVLRQKKPILPFHISIHALTKTKLVTSRMNQTGSSQWNLQNWSKECNHIQKLCAISTSTSMPTSTCTYTFAIWLVTCLHSIDIYIYTHTRYIYIHILCACLEYKVSDCMSLGAEISIKHQRPKASQKHHSLNSQQKDCMEKRRNNNTRCDSSRRQRMKMKGKSKHRMNVPQPPLCLWNFSKDSNLTANGCPVRMFCQGV